MKSLILIFISLLVFSCSASTGQFVSKNDYDAVVNDNNLKAKVITQLQIKSDSLSAVLRNINKAFLDLGNSFDSLNAFTKTRIEILQDSLFSYSHVSDSTINDFLNTINKAVILNIDSLKARIDRNYLQLTK